MSKSKIDTRRPKWLSLSLIVAVGIGLTACAGTQPGSQNVETETKSSRNQTASAVRSGDNLTTLSSELTAQKQALQFQQDRIAQLEERINTHSTLQAQNTARAETYAASAKGQENVPIYSLPEQNSLRAPYQESGPVKQASWVNPAQRDQRNPDLRTVADGDTPGSSGREFVGERPPVVEEDRPPEILALADAGGVLTPKGVLTIDPAITYSNSNVSQFSFRGVQILDAFLIGAIEATESDRDFISASLAGRYGITDRLEVSVQVPGVYRNDDLVQTDVTAVTTSTASEEETLEAFGLGDIDFGIQYQLNKPKGDWPFFVANVRGRAPTGTGPFDVDRNPNTFDTLEATTGSGFWTIQPSITVIKPTDPLVFFGNVSYLVNLPTEPNVLVGSGTVVDKFDPGDSVGINFGAALGITEKVSASFSYQHFYILPSEQTTTTTTPGVLPAGPTVVTSTSRTGDLQIGTINVALNNRLKSGSASLQVGIGVTEDAPDVAVTFRRPFNFRLN